MHGRPIVVIHTHLGRHLGFLQLLSCAVQAAFCFHHLCLSSLPESDVSKTEARQQCIKGRVVLFSSLVHIDIDHVLPVRRPKEGFFQDGIILAMEGTYMKYKYVYTYFYSTIS